jgi:hypothetical protein
MPVTDITVFQDNIVASVNLMAVHSPLVFLIDVTYTGAAPTLYCDITLDGGDPITTDATFQCVYLLDISPTVRRFMFRADSLLRGFMEDFEDFVQTAESVAIVLKTQQAFILVFRDNPLTYSDTVSLIAFAAKRQFGQTPAISEIYNNADVLYVAGYKKPIYIYFFNTVAAGVITITDGTTVYPLAVGGGAEEVISTVTMAAWTGTGNETLPSGWTGMSSQARSATWRIYEVSAGIARWIMTGSVLGDYMSLRNNAITWTKGQQVWARIRYKGGNTGVYLGVKEMSVFSTHYAHAGTVALPYAADYVTIETQLVVSPDDWVLPGLRCPSICLLSTDATEDIDVNIDSIVFYKPTTKGYYRLKVDDLEVDTTYTLKNGSTTLATKVVRVKDFCTDYKYLKYLDRNGQYRFAVFNNRWQSKDTPKAIGKIQQLITNLQTDQGSTKNVGYTNERKLTLVADDVLSDELDILSDIYTSPRVYLQIGTGDTAADWLLVDVTSSDNLVRRKKGNTSKVELTVTLPEWYNVTML